MKVAELAALLPAVFRAALDTDAILATLLAVMEDQHAPVESVLGDLADIFNPRRTPDAFVPMLARWVDLDRIAAARDGGTTHLDDEIPVGRLRELVARSFALSQMRGTAAGLVEFLEIATGVIGFSIDDAPTADADMAFHLRVHVPTQAAALLPLIERIVTSEKPAYTTWEPVFAPVQPSPP